MKNGKRGKHFVPFLKQFTSLFPSFLPRQIPTNLGYCYLAILLLETSTLLRDVSQSVFYEFGDTICSVRN